MVMFSGNDFFKEETQIDILMTFFHSTSPRHFVINILVSFKLKMMFTQCSPGCE